MSRCRGLPGNVRVEALHPEPGVPPPAAARGEDLPRLPGSVYVLWTPLTSQSSALQVDALQSAALTARTVPHHPVGPIPRAPVIVVEPRSAVLMLVDSPPVHHPRVTVDSQPQRLVPAGQTDGAHQQGLAALL